MGYTMKKLEDMDVEVEELGERRNRNCHYTLRKWVKLAAKVSSIEEFEEAIHCNAVPKGIQYQA